MSRHTTPRIIAVRMESREWRTFADVLARSPEAVAQFKSNGLRRKVGDNGGFAELEQDADTWTGLIQIAFRHARGAENGICAEIDGQVSAGMFRKPESN